MGFLASKHLKGIYGEVLIPEAGHGNWMICSMSALISFFASGTVFMAPITPSGCNHAMLRIIKTSQVSPAIAILPEIDGASLENSPVRRDLVHLNDLMFRLSLQARCFDLEGPVQNLFGCHAWFCMTIC